ncbi:uncharacterized protein LOC132612038 [Lycium barbarum]|uniref:uncharacterized protein LOC132612038 n=1 Tax=Lycium barbarum TaxID=112863 RepID=UPI00293E065F|nr:uncharacterized protein LOC132612038 [Lycium barbarum]
MAAPQKIEDGQSFTRPPRRQQRDHRQNEKEYNEADRKRIEKNYKAKKILVCGIGPDEYNRVSACSSAKEIWEALQTAHKGTTQVNAISEAKDLSQLKVDELIGNLNEHDHEKGRKE